VRPEAWSLIGVVVSALVGYGAARLNFRAQQKHDEAEEEVSAGQLALSMAKEAKADSASAKMEAVGARSEAKDAHREASAAQRALHETRIWYITEHMPWDQAVMSVISRLDPEAAANLPERKEPPLWDKGLGL
jgi:HAMP domain-containing protein